MFGILILITIYFNIILTSTILPLQVPYYKYHALLLIEYKTIETMPILKKWFDRQLLHNGICYNIHTVVVVVLWNKIYIIYFLDWCTHKGPDATSTAIRWSCLRNSSIIKIFFQTWATLTFNAEDVKCVKCIRVRIV